MTSRAFLFLVGIILQLAAVRSQVLSGVLAPGGEGHARSLMLFETIGEGHVLIDSVIVDSKGGFAFRQRLYATGFYQLASSDTDRVDLILNPSEPKVSLHFEGLPLREHITVQQSLENQRLWEYKRASRAASQTMSELRKERSTLDPRDLRALHRLDSLESGVEQRRRSSLERLIDQDRSSFFSKVVETDMRLMAAIPQGTFSIKQAMDWDDPALLRSAVYPKAIMAILQSAEPATADVLNIASDSLLAWASGNKECWTYTRSFLVELFSQYSANDVVQHLVDQYVTGARTLYPPEPELLTLVAAQMRVSIGSPAPDVALPHAGSADSVRVRQVASAHSYTVLFFYSSTCDHCHAEMPGLVQLYSEVHPRGVEFLGIALDEDINEFERTIAEEGLNFPCHTELAAWGSPVAKAFAVKATPTMILLDRSGRIVAKPYDQVELRQTLSGLLH